MTENQQGAQPPAKQVVLLVGAQGSGKTTWCREHLPDFHRISQDDQGQKAHYLLYQDALLRGEPHIVIDRINGQRYQRRRYLEPARQLGYRTRVVWLNVDRALCLRRCRERADHPTLEPQDAERAIALFFRTLQTPSRREADELEIIGPPPTFVTVHDLTADIGTRRHLIVGDVHGCLDELLLLLDRLHFDPAEDVLISVGDIVDRGPRIRATVEYLFALPHFHMVLGNHEDKLLRYLKGNKVTVSGGLETTVASYGDQFPPELAERLAALPLILKTPSGYVVHAGFDPEMPPEEQCPDDCLYMRYYGGKTYFDEMNGRIWYSLWPKEWPRVFFGHIPTADGPYLNNITGLDGGCVFGGELRIFDSRDGLVHTEKAKTTYAVSEYAVSSMVSPADQVRKREEYVARGLLRSDRTDDGTLAIYTYTDRCTFENAWDEVTRNSRGHVYNLQTGECVAWAFPKFFNLGENPESLPEKFPWDRPYEIMEKLDGWLGVLYRHEGKFKVATRGSFHSSGSVWATEMAQALDFSCLPDEATLVFEIITPEQRIILDYGSERKLVILAAFNRHTGQEYPRHRVEEWGRATGLPVVPLLGRMSLEDLLRKQKELEKFEGFVIRFCDGRRVKVKTEWYLGMARIMANLTPIAVWEAMVNGRVPPEYLMVVPEELRPLAERYQAVLEGQYARVRLHFEQAVRPIIERHGPDRRSLGKYAEKHRQELGPLRSALFLILDGRADKLDQLVKEMIYPRGNHFVKEDDLLGPA